MNRVSASACVGARNTRCRLSSRINGSTGAVSVRRGNREDGDQKVAHAPGTGER